MKVPSPRVKIIRWSKLMKVRRRFEVAIVDGTDSPEDQDGTPIARFNTEEEAVEFAQKLRESLGPWDATQVMPRLSKPKTRRAG